MKSTILGSLLVVVSLAGQAHAQQPAKVPPQLTAVIACRSQTGDQARLDCYDRAVASLAQASEQGQVVVIDREELRRTRRSLFGFSLPNVPFFRGDKGQEEEPDFIEAKIRTARPAGYNKWLVVLEDGAVWQTTEPDTRGATPKAGGTVKIKKAALGSYMITFERSRPLRGMRVR